MLDDQVRLAKKEKPLQRASLEMSLKPFKSLDASAIDEVCTEALRQWQPLLALVDTASLLLAAGFVEVRLNEKEFLDITEATQGDRIVLEGVTGRIDVLW